MGWKKLFSGHYARFSDFSWLLLFGNFFFFFFDFAIHSEKDRERTPTHTLSSLSLSLSAAPISRTCKESLTHARFRLPPMWYNHVIFLLSAEKKGEERRYFGDDNNSEKTFLSAWLTPGGKTQIGGSWAHDSDVVCIRRARKQKNSLNLR
jgi:hypothetical protein